MMAQSDPIKPQLLYITDNLLVLKIWFYKLVLPEETKETEYWKKYFPEKHNFPKVIEVEKFANSSQSLKKMSQKIRSQFFETMLFFFIFRFSLLSLRICYKFKRWIYYKTI